jgi:hypothetical protein
MRGIFLCDMHGEAKNYRSKMVVRTPERKGDLGDVNFFVG